MPLGVISVNIVGSFLMGVFVSAAAQKGLTHYAPFVMTGILGGFTTFSSFSIETITLFERGETGIYALSPNGRRALGDYADEIVRLRGR